jgi:DnaJ family protein A protein 2
MNASSDNLYSILGVSKEADDNEIRKQYKKLCLTNHPDKGGKAEEFQKVQKAYEILSDANKRQMYDATGSTEENQQINPDVDLGNIFMNMFGGGGFGFNGGFPSNMQNRKRHKAPPKIHEISVSLHDFYFGKKIKIQFERQKFCPTCKGEGSSKFTTCGQCKGHGIVEQHIMMGPGMMAVSRAPCGSCNGNGKIPSGKCDNCYGKKMFNQEKILDVHIEPGMKSGDSLLFQNECSDDPNFVEVGDVQIFFQEADELNYITRDGANLYASCIITFTESLVGMTYIVRNHPKYPDGFSIHIPKGTMNEEVIIVENEGMPKRNTIQFGNFHLKVTINISQKEKEILKNHEEEIRKLFA